MEKEYPGILQERFSEPVLVHTWQYEHEIKPLELKIGWTNGIALHKKLILKTPCCHCVSPHFHFSQCGEQFVKSTYPLSQLKETVLCTLVFVLFKYFFSSKVFVTNEAHHSFYSILDSTLYFNS